MLPALLWSSLLCAGLARASQVDAAAVSRAPDNSGALRLIVSPPQGTDDDVVIRAILNEDGAGIELRDDGKGADLHAGDGFWVGVFGETIATGDALLTLTSADGQLLWSDRIPLDGGLSRPWLSLVFTDSRVVVDVGGAGSSPGAGPAPRPDGGMSKSSIDWVWTVGAALSGLLLGLLLGRLWGRVRVPGPVVPFNAPAPSSTVTETDLDSAVELIADRARRGPVLLLPRSSNREAWRSALAGISAVRWLGDDRPSVGKVCRAWRALQAWGPTVVVVDGLQALEAADEDEPVDAVLQDVIDGCGSEVLLVVSATDDLS